MMHIKLLELNDNLQEYLECIQDLNGYDIELSNVKDVKNILCNRSTNTLTFVGLVNSKIVCAASVFLESKLRYKKKCCHIEDVAVHRAYRKQHYGVKMLDHCILFAKKMKCYKIKLNCNDSLVYFYEKMKFKKVTCGMEIKIQD